jgi:hypothetical protein
MANIIAMVLRFGTSRSDTYGLSENLKQKKTWINTPGQIVDMIQWIVTVYRQARDVMVGSRLF